MPLGPGLQHATHLPLREGRKGAFVVDPREGQDPLSIACQIKGMMIVNTENNFIGYLLG